MTNSLPAQPSERKVSQDLGMLVDRDWRTFYPFDSRFLSLGGEQMHYLDEGEGPTLLLVHGNPTWSFHWREVILGLRGRHRLVAPDHIGCGLSDKPQRYPYCLEQHTLNLVELVDRLALNDITLLAQDWGGAIGLGAALRRPAVFKRCVLFNTAAFRSSWMPWRIRVCRAPLLGTVAIRGANAFVRAALRMAVEKRERITPAVAAGIAAPYDSWAHRVAIDRFVKDIPMSPRHPSYRSLLELEQGLGKLRDKPVHLIWGMQDWCFTPAFLERFRELFPTATVHAIADAGHWVVEDAHERIVPVIAQIVASGSEEREPFAN